MENTRYVVSALLSLPPGPLIRISAMFEHLRSCTQVDLLTLAFGMRSGEGDNVCCPLASNITNLRFQIATVKSTLYDGEERIGFVKALEHALLKLKTLLGKLSLTSDW